MDGLALLCNLHADGPVSLRRLRRSGVRTLRELARVQEDSLASILQASPRLVRRLVHEALQLDERLGERPLEPEIRGSQPAEACSDLFDPVDPEVFEPLHTISLDEAIEVMTACEVEDGEVQEEGWVPFPDLEPAGFAREPGHRTIARATIRRNLLPRGYDLQPVLAGHDQPLPEAAEEPVPDPSEHPPTPLPVYGPPSVAAQDSTGTRLERNEIAGLDRRGCELLVREGILTYRSLVDLASLTLARRIGMPYTKLLELKYAATAFLRRRLAPPGPTVARNDARGEEPGYVLTPAPRAPSVKRVEPRRMPDPPADPRPDPAPPGSPPRKGTLEPAREIREDPGVAGPFV